MRHAQAPPRKWSAVHVALRFAYDGSVFPNGYARQPEGGTVEDALIAAAKAEGYLEGSWTTGSRTDKGVSAAENVAKLALDRSHLTGLVPALQAHLPDGLWVTGAAEAAEDWNPRHGGEREYVYVIPSKGETLDPMQRAADRFVGRHDMSAFARVESHRDPMRTITACRVDALDDGSGWRFIVRSPGFLWNQVRRMVDAMLAVGRGDASPADVSASLESGVVHSKFNIAPPEGLLLRSVTYEPALAWSVDAGSVDPRRLRMAWQRAQVTSELLRSLSGSS